MQNIPLSNRRHVAIFGETNAGKSSLFNAIIGQDSVIVSSEKGTTTDPIIKAMELIPFGPIALVDTAGLSDTSTLGGERMKKTARILERTDFAIYAADSTKWNQEVIHQFIQKIQNKNTPYLLVFTKIELADKNQREKISAQYPAACMVSVNDGNTIDKLKSRLAEELAKLGSEEESMIADLVPHNGTVILVCPIDSAAPKGRLILPQVQLLRDCLDNGIQCLVTKETELESAFNKLKKIDLVVTDSQAFALVDSIVPPDIPLTSFSLLMARQKGKLSEFLRGADAIEVLPENARILVAEGCSHNQTHEDIGHVKIPKGLEKKLGKHFQFDFVNGYDFPEDLSPYSLVIHCGGCMLTRKNVQNRLRQCKTAHVPITNYGVVLAYLTNILNRCRTVFQQEENCD